MVKTIKIRSLISALYPYSHSLFSIFCRKVLSVFSCFIFLGGASTAVHAQSAEEGTCRFQPSQFASANLRPNLQAFSESVPGMKRDDEVSVIWDPRLRRNKTDFIDVPRFGILGAPRKSVGRLHILAKSRSGGATCLLPCSAVLISERHIMTNKHCAAPHLYRNVGVRPAPEDFGVMFGHLSDTDPGEFFRLQREPVEISDDDRVDYAILEISEGAFPENYEPVSFAKRMPDAGDPVFIGSHPSGFRMQIDPDCSGELVNEYLFAHDCHSTGGSSGSAIFNGNGEMVALHFASGLDSGGGKNRALPVTTIVAVSSFIRGLSSEDSPRYEGEGANLKYANLTNANLTNANLKYANLKYANLIGANLIGANLIGANLKYANLISVNLTNANLKYADLKYADLIGVNLSGTDFTGSLIKYTEFWNAWAWHDKKPIGLHAGIIFCVFNPEIHRRNIKARPDVCARPE